MLPGTLSIYTAMFTVVVCFLNNLATAVLASFACVLYTIVATLLAMPVCNLAPDMSTICFHTLNVSRNLQPVNPTMVQSFLPFGTISGVVLIA